MNQSKNFVISIPWVVRVLGTIIGLLVLASTGLQLIKHLADLKRGLGVVRLFYVDEEANVPVYFSTFQLLLAAVLLAVIASFEHRRQTPLARNWTVLAVVFFGLSLDELCSLHEMAMRPMQSLLGSSNLGFFYCAWVIPAILGMIGLGLYFLRFLWRLPAAVRFRFILAAMLFVGGAVGVEILEGPHAEQYGRENLVWVVYVTVEELLEMSGILLFVHTLLQYIATNYGTLTVTFAAGSPVDDPIREA